MACGRRLQVRHVAFGRAFLDPAAYHRQLLVIQPSLANELVDAVLWEPGWHAPTHCGRNDLIGMPPCVFERQQAERRSAVGSMARRAMLEQDRRDVFRKSYLR